MYQTYVYIDSRSNILQRHYNEVNFKEYQSEIKQRNKHHKQFFFLNLQGGTIERK